MSALQERPSLKNDSTKSLLFLEVTYASLMADVYKHLSPDDDKKMLRHRDLDCTQVRERLKTEGLGFATKALPALGKALDRALMSNTRLDISTTPFRRKPGRGSKNPHVLPEFLWEAFRKVFDSDGTLKDDADGVMVHLLRTLCYWAYKLRTPFTEKQRKDAVDSFVDREFMIDGQRLESTLIPIANRLLRIYLKDFNPYDITPGHGPGAVAGREEQKEKPHVPTFYPSLDRLYPYDEYFAPPSSSDDGSWVGKRLFGYGRPMRVGHALLSRLVLVPKDSRGPRVIACEPLELMYLQQGLMKRLYDFIESHPLTRGHINFRDQGVNRSLALEASITGAFDTIDLKDASDLISVELVRRLFAGTPIEQQLETLRSSGTIMPEGWTLRNAKFSPMGSALCFPIMSLVNYFVSLASLLRHDVEWTNLPFDKEVSLAGSDLYVYGDDIICRSHDTRLVKAALVEVGLKINEDKCCVGKVPFKESCGMDAFRGLCVTPLRLRTIPFRPSDVAAIVALIDLVWECSQIKHMASLTQSLVLTAKQMVGKHLVYSEKKCGVLSIPASDPSFLIPRGSRIRENVHLQTTQILGVSPIIGKEYVNLDEREYHKKLTQGWAETYVAGRYNKCDTTLVLRPRWVAFDTLLECSSAVPA